MVLHNVHADMLTCFSRVQLFVTLWAVAHQAPLSMGFTKTSDLCQLILRQHLLQTNVRCLKMCILGYMKCVHCCSLRFRIRTGVRHSGDRQGERPARQDREHLTECHLELLLEPTGLRHMWDKRLPRLAELLTWKVARLRL